MERPSSGDRRLCLSALSPADCLPMPLTGLMMRATLPPGTLLVEISVLFLS